MYVREYLDHLRRLPVAPLDTLVGAGPAVILSPHPDDETLGCGGLIAAARAAGRDVLVMILTDGSGSHPGSLKYPAPALTQLRREESRAAVAVLGVPAEQVIFVDLKDTAAPSSGPAFDATVSRIEEVVRKSGASALFVTSGLDPHCDHQAAAAMAGAVAARQPALRLWFYPIWSWHLPEEATIETALPRGVRFAIGPAAGRKRAAIDAYASQMTELIDDDPAGFHFVPETLEPFLRPYETFIQP